MSSSEEDIPVLALPPKLCLNPRKKIQTGKVDPKTLILPHIRSRDKSKNVPESESPPVPKSLHPRPRFPLFIIWSPDRLFFELDEEPVILKLWIWNACARTIYIHCCGLWNDAARLGASWRTYPRTRFHLAPGLRSDLFIKATPRTTSPVHCAYVSLQLAASHMRDCVTGYFNVPVVAKFLKYEPPRLEYGEEVSVVE